MRKWLLIAADVVLVVLSPFAALLIRDNLVLSTQRLEAVLPYAGLTAVSALLVFASLRVHKTVWRYTSLNDILRVIAAATIAILLASSVGFALTRMTGIARSIPIIQWLLLVVGMSSTRLMVRMLLERGKRRAPLSTKGRIAHDIEHVLVVGFSNVAQLYLNASEEIGSAKTAVQGILADGAGLRRRRLHNYDVIGAPSELRHILRDQEVRGVVIKRIVIAEPFEELSRESQDMLLSVERTSNIKLDFFVDRLNLTSSHGAGPKKQSDADLSDDESNGNAPYVGAATPAGLAAGPALGNYAYVKRAFDITVSLVLVVASLPVLLIAVLLVTIDVGRELVFWQLRPGRLGWLFRLYKLRTMSAGHDAQGQAIPDCQRLSAIGRFLRRTRLDELPQLYNILVGEMSFVGPRPLLWRDQLEGDYARLVVRPGLTGWAQVNGGRALSVEDKRVLDLWYVRNASLWLDVKILLHTALMIVFGERTNAQAIRRAWKEFKNSGIPEDGAFRASHLSANSEGRSVDSFHERAA